VRRGAATAGGTGLRRAERSLRKNGLDDLDIFH